MGIQAAPVTAYHPEANGIAEAKVKALKQLRRAMISKQCANWDKLHLSAVFAFTQESGSHLSF